MLNFCKLPQRRLTKSAVTSIDVIKDIETYSYIAMFPI